MILLNIGLLSVLLAGSWWLTGFDTTASGESRRPHFVSRLLRCAAIVWLAGVFLWYIELKDGGQGGVALLLIIPPSLALLLRSSLAEVMARGVLRLVDPALCDTRPFDPGKSQRCMDAVAHLVRSGCRDEAVNLCREFEQSGDVDSITVERTLEFLGVKQEKPAASSPLTQASRFRSQEKYYEAEQLLKALLVKNPAHIDAAMLLMRLYAENLRQPERAREVLCRLEQQPHIPASHVDFARHSIDEWAVPKPAVRVAALVSESVEALVASGRFGSAVEMLEQKIGERPGDFEAWLQLAEIHGRHCHNMPRALKILRQIELSPDFSRAQFLLAEARFKTWRETAEHVK